MKKRLASILALSVCFCMLYSPVFGQAWVAKAKAKFEDDRYQDVIKITENMKKNMHAVMFLAFSHLQENLFNKTKYDKEKYKAYNMLLEAKLGIDDIDHLLYFINLNDKPKVVDAARKLAKHTFKNIKRIEDVPKLVTYLNSSDEGAKKLALSTITRILKPKRKMVEKGGTMRPKDVKVMQSKNLITALLENITQGDARKALLIIEEPVLEYTGKYSGNETAKLEVKINKDIAKRKKKYPESNWYSATGKTR